MSKKLYEIVSRVMNIPISQIDDKSSAESIDDWDSFTLYVLLDEIENEYKVKFTLEEILEIKNVGDFKKCLKLHGAICE